MAVKKSQRDENTREEKVSALLEKLENGIREIYESGAFADYVAKMSMFPSYSTNNCILILCQHPTAQLVCSFNTWKESFHRYVKKGESGIQILAPIKVKGTVKEQLYDADGVPLTDEKGKPKTETVTREFLSFKPVYVFADDQTEGEPLPSLVHLLDENVDDFEQIREILMEVSPVPVSFEPIHSGANGYYSPGEGKIVIKEELPQAQQVKTLCHEIAHAWLGHGGQDDKWPQEVHEVQAEAVAACVCGSIFHLDTSEYSCGYLVSWSKDREVSELKENLDVIRRAVDEISTAIRQKIEQKLPDLQKEMNQRNTEEGGQSEAMDLNQNIKGEEMHSPEVVVRKSSHHR